MPFPPKLADFLSRAGWRRLSFAGFCLLMVGLGARYLAKEVVVDPRGEWVTEFAVFRSVVKWSMIGFGLLAVATPWLVSKKLAALAPSKILKVPPGERRWFWIGVAVCTLASGLMWSKRMERSLWADELTSMRRVMVGRWKHNGQNGGRFRQPSWADTLLHYETPNNHLAYSVTARFLHEKLGGVNKTDFSKPYFNAWVLRLPAFLAGLACIGLIGYLALRLHSLLAAWLAMSWATLHPWMLEFATSARGYSFGMVFLALAAVAAVKIFRGGGGWRWWLVYGAAQMLAFSTIPTLVHGLIGLNLAVFAGLLFDRSVDREARNGHVGAFFAVNIVAGIGAIASLYPRLEQLRHYLDGDQFSVAMPLSWMRDCVCHLLVGQPFDTWATEEHPWASSADHWPVLLIGLGTLLALNFAVAAVRYSWRGGVFVTLLVLAFIVPHLTVFLQGMAMHFYLFPWYSAWGLPLALVFFAIGAAALITRVTKSLPTWVPPAAGSALFLVLVVATQQPRTAYLNISVEPMMESAASFRASPNPWAPGHEKVLSCSLISANHGYDPWNRRLRSVDDLYALTVLADASGLPLFCDTSWIDRIPDEHPTFAPVLLDERYFEQAEHFYGLQPQNSRYVLRYIPDSLSERVLDR